MASYSFPPSATIYPLPRNNAIPRLSSLSAFSDINLPPDALTRSRSRAYIVSASADAEKKKREAARGIEPKLREMLDLKFGHPIGDNPQKTFPKEGKDDDWARAESLHKSGELEEVELVSCFKSGFAVSFGSLIGFLPHRDLGPQRKYSSFEAWLQEKGPDPSTFKKGKEHAAMRIEQYQRRLHLYNRDRTNFFSYFVGQKTRARVTSIDRKSGRLLFSEKPIEGRDFGKKKENLMDKLNIGDVVSCKITSMSYFGVFVELEGVEALIHRSELSWDPLWDVHSFLKVGEIVKAKVCHLDHSLQRINLSLKQMQTDQVVETLESVINEDNCPTKGNLELQEFENEWPEVGSLIRELKLVGGIHSVSKGWLLLCPRWAPKFQVSLCDSHGIQYKILAKSGYRVQEIIIQASLNRDGIKSAIHHALHDMYKQ